MSLGAYIHFSMVVSFALARLAYISLVQESVLIRFIVFAKLVCWSAVYGMSFA